MPGNVPSASPPRAVVALAAVLVGGAWAAPGGDALAPGGVFRDALRSGGQGPEMVVIPPGRFRMGCDRGDRPRCGRLARPAREVRFGAPFAMSKYEVTFEDYDRFLKAKGGARHDEALDRGWGRGRRPVIYVTRAYALEYAAWLSAETGARYRLPSEAEWEYAARAGTATLWPWGDEHVAGRANCSSCGSRWDRDRTAPVGSFPPNAWGLHDMAGNVHEMLLDCWHRNYKNLPTDGTARTDPARESEPDEHGDCRRHASRGGSWVFRLRSTHSSHRVSVGADQFGAFLGIRLVRQVDDSAADSGPGAAAGPLTAGSSDAGG